MLSRGALILLATLVLVGISACDLGMVNTETEPVSEQMLALSSEYTRYTKVTAQPFGSALGDFKVVEYISSNAAEFRKIKPSVTGSGAKMPVGTLIVREVLDATGAPSKLTLMGKGPAGYDARLGDWWFGVTDLNGEPIADAAGNPQIGKMVACHACHNERGSDDFLFGAN